MLTQITEPSRGRDKAQDDDRIEAVGIDLGTTNSLAAFATNEQPQAIKFPHGDAIIESLIYLDDNGNIAVGKKINDIDRKIAISSFKRLIGKGYEDITTEDLAKNEIASAGDGQYTNIKLGDRQLNPIEASSYILKALKENSEEQLGYSVNKAVITVPAYFNDAQRQATKDAAKLAGLEVLRLINEPTAAALAYGLDNSAEGIYAVYDFGGGTFDVSILKMQMGVFRVIATGGDSQLGGDDIDNLIVKELITKYPSLKNKVEENIANSRTISFFARQIKESLSGSDEFNGDIFGVKVNFSKQQLAKITQDIIAKTIDVMRSVLVDAGLTAQELREIILVGGSTKMPLIQTAIEDNFGKKPLCNIDPDKIVAYGAAIQAEALTKGSGNLLLDICPLSLGLETYGGLMEVIIPRNTTIPAKISQKFTTFEDNQTGLNIHVLQGERELAANCRSLAKFDLTGLPPRPAGTLAIEISFILDADSILSVVAREETTGKEIGVEVRPSYGLTVEDMQKILFSSMETAKEDIKLRLLTESRVEAEAVIKVIKNALEVDGYLIDAEYRATIEKQIENLQNICQQEDRELIHATTKKLDEIASDFGDLRVSKALTEHLKGKKVDSI